MIVKTGSCLLACSSVSLSIYGPGCPSREARLSKAGVSDSQGSEERDLALLEKCVVRLYRVEQGVRQLLPRVPVTCGAQCTAGWRRAVSKRHWRLHHLSRRKQILFVSLPFVGGTMQHIINHQMNTIHIIMEHFVNVGGEN